MQFRKRPVVIEAVQFTEQETAHWQNAPEWLSGAVEDGKIYTEGGKLCIVTLEGVMTANLGDWIIKGVKGELYPCKPDIFAATYEPAGE
jgi:hypothetical protein